MSKFDSGRFKDTRGSQDDGFRRVNEFTTKIHADRQGKHIPGHKNYIAGKSVLHLSLAEAQQLVEQYAGTGRWPQPNKEVIDFGRNIGTWVSFDGTERLPTTCGTVHYSKSGCHIIPSRPTKEESL